jgi:hypothetical protein
MIYKAISNIEQGISNVEGINNTSTLGIRYSVLDIFIDIL